MLTLQTNLRIAEAVNPKMEELRAKLEDILNLEKYHFDHKLTIIFVLFYKKVQYIESTFCPPKVLSKSSKSTF